MIGAFGILVLIYSILTLVISVISHFDFLRREFISNEDKVKWRKKIFRTWTGKFEYFFKIVLNFNQYNSK